MDDIEEFLLTPTPPQWCERALGELETLLLDHAGLELKAAHQAQRLIWNYGGADVRAIPDRQVQLDLLQRMSRLAREELRHFEQVLAVIDRRGIAYRPLSSSGYAAALRGHVRGNEPDRLVDTLIVGALIEARSCERFGMLTAALEPGEPELAAFYRTLLRSEARHFRDYLTLAERIGGRDTPARVEELRRIEAPLMHVDSPRLRFHSGVAVTA